LILVLEGGGAFGWFAWSFARTTAETRRISATFDEGNRLYWIETNRCEGNFEKRFGQFRRSDQACFGNLAVTSRSPNAYPYTRILVNDGGDAYLLFSPLPEMETTAGLREGPLARLNTASDGALSGDGDLGLGPIRLTLQPKGSTCEATVTRGGKVSILGLERKILPRCEDPTNPSVRYVGAFGAIIPTTSTASTSRRLIQIWMWQISNEVRGVLLHDYAPAGMKRDFVFVQPFRGTETGPNRWDVRLDEGSGDDAARLAIIIGDKSARILGPETIVGPGGEATCPAGEIVTNPRIELVPVRDRVLFVSYFDKALFNLNIPWIVPK
ncbi:MAG: hypothetical protein JWM69_1378, partial [Candidatus Binatus sp.]|nr:hypothetical protein [Candidatus Binatus sp.]